MADEAQEPIRLKGQHGRIYTVPTKEDARKAIEQEGLTLATLEDEIARETSVRMSGVGESLQAMGVGALSMATLGQSDLSIERNAPGYLKEIEDHQSLARGIGEFVPMLAASLLTGGGATAARGGAASALGRAGAAVRATAAGTPTTAALRAGVALESELASRGASQTLAFLGRSVANEMALGTLLGTQQGFKQSAIEGADWDRAMAMTVGKHAATGALLGAGFGALGAGISTTKKALTGGLELRGVPKGTAEATSSNLLRTAEERVFAQPGKEGLRGPWDYTKAHAGKYGKQAAVELHQTKAIREKAALLDELDKEVGTILTAVRDVDYAASAHSKPGLVSAYATNHPVGSKQFDALMAEVQGIRASLSAELRPAVTVSWSKADKVTTGMIDTTRYTRGKGTTPQGFELHTKPVVKYDFSFIPKEGVTGLTGGPNWVHIEAALEKLSHKSMRRSIKKYKGSAGIVTKLDEFKRSLPGDWIQKRHNFGTLTTVAKALDTAGYTPAKAALENQANVGKAFANFQTAFNEGSWKVLNRGSSWKETVKNMAKLGDRTHDQPWAHHNVPVRDKIETAIAAIGTERGGRIFQKELRGGLQSQRQRAQAILDLDAASTKMVPDTGEVKWSTIVGNARKVRDAADKVLASLDVERVGALYPQIEAANVVGILKAQDRAPLLSGSILGIPVGAGARGALGFAKGLPGGVGSAFREAGMAASGLESRPVAVMMAAGDIYNASQAARSVVDRGMGKFFSGAKRAPGVAPRARGRVSKSFVYSRALLTNQQVDYEKTLDRLQAKNADPKKAEDEILESLEGLGDSGSDFRISAVSKAKQIREYLLSIAPTESMNTFILGRRRPVSRMESETFNRVKDILENPDKMVKRMADNRLTMDEVRAVKTIYPEWYKEMQLDAMGAMMELAEKGETLPFAKRLGLWRYLGIPTDPLTDTAFIRYMTMEYAKDRKKQPKPPPQSQKKSRLAESYESESQKTEEGVGAR